MSQSLEEQSPAVSHGEVFTKPSVVALMLSASGFDLIEPSPAVRVLEPSCGSGEFLVAILSRWLSRKSFRESLCASPGSFRNLICAYELQEHNGKVARKRVISQLGEAGLPRKEATALAKRWIRTGDFLTARLDSHFDLVIGNPPYVRIEEINKASLERYRQDFSTMTDRADLYVPFFERSLGLLKERGRLCFICTDRWTKNRYGRKLRALVSSAFQLDLYVDFYGVDAFLSEVITYPAVTVISRKSAASGVRFIDSEAAGALAELGPESVPDAFAAALEVAPTFASLTRDEAPWVFGCQRKKSLMDRLERDFPTLEDAGCQVNIGAATGNNRVFLVDDSVDIEPSRKLPCLTSKDLSSDGYSWPGRFMVNPYDANGLVDLEDYPKLQAYLSQFREALAGRHTAKACPQQWYKTIDRIHEDRANTPKLLVPDIKDRLTVVPEDGRFFANNSLYFIFSDSWSLSALRAVLLVIGPLFIEAYSTRVAGGHLRFQAQHLRRIRIPHWWQVSEVNRTHLEELGRSFDRAKAVGVLSEVYSLSPEELGEIL